MARPSVTVARAMSAAEAESALIAAATAALPIVAAEAGACDGEKSGRYRD
jgi:hypothetical protein